MRSGSAGASNICKRALNRLCGYGGVSCLLTNFPGTLGEIVSNKAIAGNSEPPKILFDHLWSAGQVNRRAATLNNLQDTSDGKG
jgi:hypothetical protein